VILHELEDTNDTFDFGKQRRNRAPILSIELRFSCNVETFCLVKNRALMG